MGKTKILQVKVRALSLGTTDYKILQSWCCKFVLILPVKLAHSSTVSSAVLPFQSVGLKTVLRAQVGYGAGWGVVDITAPNVTESTRGASDSSAQPANIGKGATKRVGFASWGSTAVHGGN